MGLSLVLTFSLLIVSSAADQASPRRQGPGSSPQDFLDAHNRQRTEAGVAPMVWDEKVASYAMDYAKQRMGDCALEHSQSGYAENIATGGQLAEEDAVNMWVGEKEYYDKTTNTCQPGQVCGHYLNVVASLSTRLGCARVQCANTWIFIICDYAAPSVNDPSPPVTAAPTPLLPAKPPKPTPIPHGDSNSKEFDYAVPAPPSIHHIPPPGGEKSLQQDFLDGHNRARAKVGVPPLVWDDAIAWYAMKYANVRKGDCALKHSLGKYGENLAMKHGSLSPAEAVNMWVGEKLYYDMASNKCATGRKCGHYKQVVWRNTKRIGCAAVQCATGGTFIACNYDPPGNYIREYPY